MLALNAGTGAASYQENKQYKINLLNAAAWLAINTKNSTVPNVFFLLVCGSCGAQRARWLCSDPQEAGPGLPHPVETISPLNHPAAAPGSSKSKPLLHHLRQGGQAAGPLGFRHHLLSFTCAKLQKDGPRLCFKVICLSFTDTSNNRLINKVFLHMTELQMTCIWGKSRGGRQVPCDAALL